MLLSGEVIFSEREDEKGGHDVVITGPCVLGARQFLAAVERKDTCTVRVCVSLCLCAISVSVCLCVSVESVCLCVSVSLCHLSVCVSGCLRDLHLSAPLPTCFYISLPLRALRRMTPASRCVQVHTACEIARFDVELLIKLAGKTPNDVVDLMLIAAQSLFPTIKQVSRWAR